MRGMLLAGAVGARVRRSVEAASFGLDVHTRLDLGRLFLPLEATVVVRMVVAGAHDFDSLCDQGIPEARIEVWRRDALAPLANYLVTLVSVLGKGNVDECHVHVDLRVFAMAGFQALCCRAEPVDLIVFQPVVAVEVAFVWRVGVCVEEVEGEGCMCAGAWSLHFEDVVSDAG